MPTFAFLAPSFLADVLSGALGPALVPALVQARETGTGEIALYSHALRGSVVLLGGAAILAAAAILVAEPSSIGIHLASPALTKQMMLIMMPMLPLSAVACVPNDWGVLAPCRWVRLRPNAQCRRSRQALTERVRSDRPAL
jgi:hypothetical protein